MGKIKVHAGDFLDGDNYCGPAAFLLITKEHRFWGEKIPLTELETVEIATEESVRKLGGAIGLGVASAILFGPVGLLAGLLLAGKKKKVTFVAKFKDGRKLLATTDSKTYIMLQAAVF